MDSNERTEKQKNQVDNNIAVLISGTGRTLKNLLDEKSKGNLPINIALVISSKKNVAGIEIAKNAGIETFTVPRKDFGSDESFSDVITQAIESKNKELLKSNRNPIQLIVMAGFIHKYLIPEKYRLKVMNIHPALIPMFCGKGFYGKKVHEAVWRSGIKVTGCTVHFADNIYDHGPIILQKAIPILDIDNPESIAKKVFEVECELYPLAINLYFQGKLEIKNGRVIINQPSRN